MNWYNFFSKIVFFLLLLGCSSAKNATVAEMKTDFSKYKSFSFLNWQKDIDSMLNEPDKKMLRGAFIEILKKHNISFIEKGGDIAITLFVVVDNEISTSSYTNYYTAYGGRYAGRYNSGWGGGHSATVYRKRDYERGSLIVDMFEEASGEQIWQGVASKVISDKPKNREKSISKKLKVLLQKLYL